MTLLVKIISTFFGVGYLPLMSGTWASAVAAILVWFLGDSLLIWTSVFTAAGLLVCRASQDALGSKDPKAFVMDEVCGMMLTLLWLPKNIYVYLAAFLLFRVLDVVKPWPISKLQQSAHASSIMTDDLAAGLAGNLILQALLRTVIHL